MNAKHHFPHWASIAVRLFLAAAAMGACTPVDTGGPPLATTAAAHTPTPSPRSSTPTPLPATAQPEGESQISQHAVQAYGIVYPYPPGEWSETDRLGIRQRLSELRQMQVDTVIQIFPSRPAGEAQEKGWLIFLDEAQRADIRVIARVYPADERAWYGFRYTTIRRFLNVIGGHPALLAYLGLAEPFELYTSAQLQGFYKTMKRIAPDLPVAHLLGDIAAFDESERFPNRQFTTGICDICVISYYPAQSDQGEAVFDEDQLLDLLRANRRLVSERDPDAQIWFLGQAFAQDNPQRAFRMPSPAEMKKLFATARREGVDGFLWYPWIHEAYDQVLGDEQSQAQQKAVEQIGQSRLTPQPTP